ncbi:MAG TPA: hypothetical protein VFW50_08940 [Streptosporangiaceae bacterium]|nr:hypothetical protein [Streptosporangiaceae bacterium]
MPDRYDRHDRHDDVDAWLNERIEPLSPPPGTFDLIKRRARRRKFRRLAITASSAAVIVAAAVTVPQVVNLPILRENPTAGSAARTGQSTSATPSTQSTGAPSIAVSSAQPVPTAAPVPDNFRPTSVTFVSKRTGWVIGQAGSPGHCATQYCTSMARTTDAGRSWSGVPAPLAGAPDGATGVSQIRFLNLNDGWAFGPGLFVTHTGGQTWTPVNTGGLRVTSLETVGTRVYALWASCTGTGAAYASNCTAFTLYSASAAGGGWAPVGPATTGLASGAPGQAASLVLTGSRGYLLAPDGTLYAGPVDGSAGWRRAGSLPGACQAGDTGTGGSGTGGSGTGGSGTGAQPPEALLGAVDATNLILSCLIPDSRNNPAAPAEQKLVYSSPNRGTSWIPMGTAPAQGIAASLAASPAASVMLATDRGIELLPRGETAWRAATLTQAAPAGGFSYVGMTSDDQGIALPADPSAGTVWFTYDGGQTWRPSAVASS